MVSLKPVPALRTGKTPLDIALGYIGRGWAPVPVRYRSKQPTVANWPNLRIDASIAGKYFSGRPQNIGVVLGAASNGLADVDLDCPEAIAAAAYLLPPTGAIFGRRSKQGSHWLYVIAYAEPGRKAVLNFDDPAAGDHGKSRLVELRLGGDAGAQTVFPGSVHADGEPIEWETEGDPAIVPADLLHQQVRRVAAASLLARQWPAEGRRHGAALVIGGVLGRAGWSAQEAAVFVEATAKAAGDSEWKDRATAGRDAVHAHNSGKHTYGLAQLRQEFPAISVAGRVAEWVGYGDAEPAALVVDMGLAVGAEGVTLSDFHAFMPTHNYIYGPTREMWPAASVNARIPPVEHVVGGNTVKLKASDWLDRNRPVEQMTWAPGLPQIIEDRLISDGGWIDRPGNRCFNLYRPPTIGLGDPDKAAKWLAHVGRVYGSDADHIIRWLAHRVQRPQEKINHALVLGGLQGIGKDSLLEPVIRAVGPWNFSEVSPQQLLGRFNSFAKSVILRVSEARDLGEVDRFAFYDHTKAYAAAPPDLLRVDEKNLREYSVFNVTGLIITTNHKSDGIYLPEDDRRHYVAWSPCSKEDFPKDYWKSLWGWYSAGGVGNVAAYLARLDLSGFDCKAPPPKTAAFWEIVNANRPTEDAELSDALDTLGNPPATTIDRIAKSAGAELATWLKDRKTRRAIPHRLEAVGYEAVRNPVAADGHWKIGGKRQMVYARRDLSLRDRIAAATRLAGQCSQ